MKCSLLAPLLALFPIVLGRTVGKRADYAVKSSHFVPSEWLQVGRAEADHPINLRIGLKQAAFHELERHLYEVSDPSHARYGQHLSADDIHPLVAPTKDALNALQGWLKVCSSYAIETPLLSMYRTMVFSQTTLHTAMPMTGPP